MNNTCSINSSHPGPFALYLWLDRVSYISNTKKCYSTRISEYRSVLCESCAKRVGAWKLPAKPVEVEEDDPNYHGEERDEFPDGFDDTPVPNNNLRGNPYQ